VVSNDELHSAKLIIAVKIVQNFGNDEKPFCNSKILQLKLRQKSIGKEKKPTVILKNTLSAVEK